MTAPNPGPDGSPSAGVEASTALTPLPPPTRPSPTRGWVEVDPPPDWDLDRLCQPLFADTEVFGETWAVAVAHRGALVYERYAGRLPGWGGPGEVVGAGSRLLSWSVAKSVLHAAVGVLVGAGRLHLDAPAGVAAWSDPADPRHHITLDDLLHMRDGLDFVEDYDPGEGRSDVIAMLFGATADMAAFAADRPLAAPPGTRYNYSSGTSNIVSGLVAATVGSGSAYERWLHSALFDPLGMDSAEAEFDPAGTWIASSYLRATARDWLKFGELYLRDGYCDGVALLPRGWVDHARSARSADPDGSWHGAHWWTDRSAAGTFWAEGYEGQTVVVCPQLDLVAVRFGRTPGAGPALADWRRQLLGGLGADVTPL